MIRQYPYTLQVYTNTPAHQDDQGNWIPGTQSWDDYAACRDEDGRGQKRKGADGSDYIVAMVIQMPRGTEPVAVGTQIKVLDGTTVRGKGTVLYSRKGQLHTQLWV